MKTYHLLRFASWITKYIPAPLAYWLCQLFGTLLFYVKPVLRRRALDNLEHVLPTATMRRKRAIVRRVFRNNFKNYYDLVRLPHLEKEDMERMVTIYGIEHLDAAVAKGKGVIVLSAHMGNYNLVPQLVMTRGYTGAVVAEDIKPDAMYNLVNQLRARFGLKFIRAGSSQVRTIYKHLKSNGILLLAGDRDVADSGVPVKFFDAVAELPSGPVVLAMRLNATLLPAYTVRTRSNRSIVQIYPALELQRTGNRDVDLEVNMRRAAEVIETMVMKAPYEWVALLQKIWDKEESRVAQTGTETVEGTEGNILAAKPESPDGSNGQHASAGGNGHNNGSLHPARDPLGETQALEVVSSEDKSPSSVS